MKNYIYENYDLIIEQIYKNFFIYNDEKIYIYHNNYDKKYIENLITMSNELYMKGININTFLINKNNQYYLEKNNKLFFLIKENNINDKITLKYLLKYKGLNYKVKEYDLKKELQEIIDSYEKIIYDEKQDYKIIYESANYFIGMSENAIQLLDGINIKNEIAHLVKVKDMNTNNFENPLTFINTTYILDLSNYIKYKFYYEIIDYEEVYKIINMLEDEEQTILFALLLFQNEYFECINEIINENESENNIKIFINKISMYKELLKYCQKNMKKSKKIKLITWIND